MGQISYRWDNPGKWSFRWDKCITDGTWIYSVHLLTICSHLKDHFCCFVPSENHFVPSETPFFLFCPICKPFCPICKIVTITSIYSNSWDTKEIFEVDPNNRLFIFKEPHVIFLRLLLFMWSSWDLDGTFRWPNQITGGIRGCPAECKSAIMNLKCRVKSEYNTIDPKI